MNTQRSGWQNIRLQSFRPLRSEFRAFQRDIERRLDHIGGRNINRTFEAEIIDPDFKQPIRRVETRHILTCNPVAAFIGNLAQDRVDESLHPRMAFRLYELNGCIHGGMIRHVHKNQLCHTHAHNIFQHRRIERLVRTA